MKELIKKLKIENVEHQKQQPQIAIKNLTFKPSWCRLDSSYCWSKKKPGLGSISHTILTIFFSFLQTGTHYFAKWGEVTSWILKSSELCFALRYSASSAQQRAAKLSSAVHESSVELRAQWTRGVQLRLVRCFFWSQKNISSSFVSLTLSQSQFESQFF